MKRKIVKLGTATLVVSLPSKWTKKFKINQGDEINLKEKDNSLILSTEKSYGIDKTKIDLTNVTPFLAKRIVSALHKIGYDEIDVDFKDSHMINAVQKAIQNVFMGFEIIDQRENSCKIKAISAGSDSDFDAVVRRAFLVTKSLGENTYEILKKGDLFALKDAVALEITNNKLTNFLERVLNKKGYKDTSRTTFMYCIVWELEKIADDYKYICEYMTDKKVKISKQTLDLYKEINNFYNEFYELYYKYDHDKLVRATNTKKALQKKATKLLVKTKGHELVIIRYLLSLIEKIFDLSGPYLGLLL